MLRYAMPTSPRYAIPKRQQKTLPQSAEPARRFRPLDNYILHLSIHAYIAAATATASATPTLVVHVTTSRLPAAPVNSPVFRPGRSRVARSPADGALADVGAGASFMAGVGVSPPVSLR